MNNGQIGAGGEIIFYIYELYSTFRVANWENWSRLVHVARHGVNHSQAQGGPRVNQVPLMG